MDNDFIFRIGQEVSKIDRTIRFGDYLKKIHHTPELADLSPDRVYRMIESHGVITKKDGSFRYEYFNNSLFGAEEPIKDAMAFFKGASMDLELRKRVLLLLGPPGGGKSQFINLLKSGLSEYSKTQKGAVFAIATCPINENPLHLIPHENREEFYERYGVKIKGSLCPACQHRFNETWHKNLNNVEIKKVIISEENRKGIGTFSPSENNNMEELYGSVNQQKLAYFGEESDARSHAFDGELHQANRGIMEFIEVLKAKTSFLHVLLTLAEEQQFKTPRFPLQYVDETIVAHTNYEEFEEFLKNKENRAILDRFHIVKFPYLMNPDHEKMIYKKNLSSAIEKNNLDISEDIFKMVSSFIVKTRRSDDPNRNGMIGLSPRFAIDTMSSAIARTSNKTIHLDHVFLTFKKYIDRDPRIPIDIKPEYHEFLHKSYLDALREDDDLIIN